MMGGGGTSKYKMVEMEMWAIMLFSFIDVDLCNVVLHRKSRGC